MSNELQSLSVLFQNRLFRIPDYQRGYAWTETQFVDFWEDLMNLHEDKDHYTGLLSLKLINRNDVKTWHGDEWLLDNGYKPFYIVDGQQRLTTFSILIYEIVSLIGRLPDNQDKLDENIFLGFESLEEIKTKYIVRKRRPQNIVTTYLFGYETDNPSADYLRHKIFDEPFGGTIIETYYTRNLKLVKSFFAKELCAVFENDGIQGILSLYRKLTLHLKFNLHEIEDDYDVFVAFETMNNRGKKLTNLELLKNRLIYLTTLFDDKQLDTTDKEHLRKNINDAWKEVYSQLGRNKDEPLPDDDFLRAHWITKFRYSRKGGDDYIRFLLGKFSAKNVFEKHTPSQETEPDEVLSNYEYNGDDEVADIESEPETSLVSKLAPEEIRDYVNSLKALAEYWYYSRFPSDSTLEEEEKIWIDKLNRVSIGHFRPLVVAALATKEATPEERITLLQAIERFIFVCFRIGGFQANYQSSVYYNKSRDVLNGNASIVSIAEELNNTVNNDMASAIVNFISRTKRRFDSGEGFYGWRDLRYFLYEYEFEKAIINKIQKVDWDDLFTNVEKEKVSIEHILPQKPTKWYWRNTYRVYNNDEIKQLSASLGNLLPLSQSINSSLQNDGFPDKKRTCSSGRRGYVNGSHSEIEVAQETDWTAQHILKRGLSLLAFMESRWRLALTDEQKSELLHISFVNDTREELPKIPETDEELSGDGQSSITREHSERQIICMDFWSRFVEYCKENGRGDDIASGKPSYNSWYDVTIDSRDYHVFFQLYYRKKLCIGLYVYRQEDFARLNTKKTGIEAAYGSELEWDTNREKSRAKRILHFIDADVLDANLYQKHFDWFISQFDKLHNALKIVDSDF